MRTLLCALLLSASSGVASAQFALDGATDDLEATVEAMGQAWIDAYVASDIDALVKMHSADSVILSPGGIKFEGPDGVRSYYELVSGAFPTNRQVTVKESSFRQYGDIIVTNSTWDLSASTPDGRQVQLSGHTSSVLQNTPDGLYIVDYNPAVNLPPPLQN